MRYNVNIRFENMQNDLWDFHESKIEGYSYFKNMNIFS